MIKNLKVDELHAHSEGKLVVTIDIKKVCPKCEGLCCIEIFDTLVKPPKNIRIGCSMHGYVLPGCFSTVSDAVAAWNRRAEEGGNND